MEHKQTVALAEAKDISGVEYTVWDEKPQVGESYYYQFADSPKVDVVYDIVELANIIRVQGVRFSLIGIGACKLAFPLLPVLDLITDEMDLYYNAGQEIFIRMDGEYYRRTPKSGWELTVHEQTPGIWSGLLQNQKDIYLPQIIQQGLIG